MIIIDEDRLKLSDLKNYKGDDDLLISFKRKLKEVEDHFSRYPAFRLKWAEKFENFNPETKKKEPKSCAIVLFRSELNIGGSNRTAIYYTSDTKDGNGTPNYMPHYELFDGNMIFTQNDTERLVWYLVCEPHLRQGMIVAENIEKDAQKIAVTRGQNADLLFFIYSDASPLDEARVKSIAYMWGIDITKFQTLELLKNQLYNTVLSEEGRKPGFAIAEFKKQTVGLSDEMKALSIVVQGVYKKVIEFNHAESAWFWKGDTSDPILKIPVNDRGDEMAIRKRLANFLIVSEKLYLLKEALNITDDEDLEATSVDLKFDKYTDFSTVKFQHLKKALREIDAPFEKTDKQDKLIERCREAYKNVEP